jgi:hypothetical protein
VKSADSTARKFTEATAGILATAGAEDRTGTIEERVARLELKAAEAKTELSTLVTRIDIDAQGNRAQSIWLAVATCIGTIAWGFGDISAKYLM